jgi:hypothetical protein
MNIDDPNPAIQPETDPNLEKMAHLTEELSKTNIFDSQKKRIWTRFKSSSPILSNPDLRI